MFRPRNRRDFWSDGRRSRSSRSGSVRVSPDGRVTGLIGRYLKSCQKWWFVYHWCQHSTHALKYSTTERTQYSVNAFKALQTRSQTYCQLFTLNDTTNDIFADLSGDHRLNVFWHQLNVIVSKLITSEALDYRRINWQLILICCQLIINRHRLQSDRNSDK